MWYLAEFERDIIIIFITNLLYIRKIYPYFAPVVHHGVLVMNCSAVKTLQKTSDSNYINIRKLIGHSCIQNQTN